jgi:hypothetical protein
MKFKEWLINEINQQIATRIKSVSHRTLNNVFGKKDRIAVPFGIDPSAKYLVKKLDDEEYDYETGLLTRTAKNGSPEKVKLMKLIDSLELPEPVINWAKKQPDIYKSLKTTKEIVTKSKDSNENYSIIITRNPIDVVRMGDFDCLPNQAGGRSCHAPSGDFFHNALEEAEKEGGAVAYVVKNEDLKNVDLDQDEIFADPERNKDGIYPVSRIRIRRFESKSDKSEVAVPEMKMYGKSMPGFFFTLKNFLRNKQEIDELDPEDHVLTGGTYFDTGKEKLFKNFFDDEADYVEDEGGYEEVIDDDEDDYETVMENERIEVMELIRRERDSLPNNVEIVFEQEGPGMGLYFRAKYEKTLEVSIKDIPENSEVMKSKENEWNKFSDEFINESIKELSESHALSSYFSVRKDQMLNNCFYKINDTKFTSSDDKKVWFKFLIYWIPSDHRRYHRDVTGLENFIDDIVGKFAGDYNYIEKTLRQNLEEYNYISHHPISNMLKQKSEEFQDKYENISTSHVDVDKNDTSEKPHYAEFTISVRVLSEIKDDQDKFIYEELARSWYRSDQGTKLQFGFSSSQESAYLERYVRAIKEFKEKFLQKLYSFSQDVFPRFQTNVTINSDHLASPYNIPIEFNIYAPHSSHKDPSDRNSPMEFSEYSSNKQVAVNFNIHINQTSDRNVTIFLLELFDFYNKNKQKLDQFIAKDFNTKILVPLVASMKTIRP